MKTCQSVFLFILLSLFYPVCASAIDIADCAPCSISNIHYFTVQGNEPDPHDALAHLKSRLAQVTNTQQFDQGIVATHAWIYFPVTYSGTQKYNWRLIASVSQRPLLAVWIFRHSGNREQILATSMQQTYVQRPTDFRFLTSKPFSMTPGETIDVLIQYHTDGLSRLPLYLDTTRGFIKRSHADTLSSAIFYCFSITLIVIFLLFSVAVRHNIAIMFAILLSLGLLNIATGEGFAFAFLWPNSPWWNGHASLTLMFIIDAFGLWLATRANLKSRSRFVLVTRLLAFISLILVPLTFISSYAWLIYTGMLLQVLMFISLAWSLASWKATLLNRDRYAWLFAAFIALLVIIIFITSLWPSLLSEQLYMTASRSIFLLTMISIMFIITLHMQGLHRDHERALEKELDASRREAETNLALFEAEKNYRHAHQLAEQRQRQLASTAHDIRQPLLSLRATLDAMTANEPAETREHLHKAFDYLEGITRRSSRDEQPRTGNSDHDITSDETSEIYSLAIVIQTVTKMFAQEATSKGIEFNFHPSRCCTNAPALVVTRIISNLVSNALKHTVSGRIVLGVRKIKGKLRLEVHDTGPGMDAAQLDRMKQAYQKGDQSTGEGLGLAICQQLAEQHRLEFDIVSHPGRGTCCRLSVPRVDCRTTHTPG